VNVSSDGAGNFPQVAVDSAGNVNIAYVDFVSGEPTNGVWFVRGSFSGGTFHPNSSPVRISKNAGGTFSMTLESSCVIDIAYMDQVSQFSSQGDIFFAQSTDCGATFTSTNITNSALTYYSHQGPELVLNNGVAEVLWTSTTDATSTQTTLFYAQRASANSFTTPTELATSPNEMQCLQALATPTGGSTDIVWCDGSVEFLNSVNGAAPIMVGPGGEARFAVDSQGDINVVWTEPSSGGSIEFSRSAGQTGTFSAPKELFAGYDPNIIVDKNGDLDLAYWAGEGAVLFSRSTNGGNNFSAPVTIAPPLSGLGSPAVVQMAVDSTGVVDLTWEYPQVPQGILFSRSDSQGASFSAPGPVSASLEESPSSVQITTDATNHVLVLWSQNDVFISEGDAPTATSEFTISATPSSLVVLPGGTATAQVTVTATGGFNQAVNLSCGNLPSGAECSFSPASVTPSTSGTVVSLTLTIPPTLLTGAFPFTVNVATPTISQFQNMQLTVGTMTSLVTPMAAIISIGGTASFAVTVASSSGFAGQFSLACSAPAGVTCTFNPNSASLPLNGTVSSTMTVQVLSLPATASASKNPKDVYPLALPSMRNAPAILGLSFVLVSALIFGFFHTRDGTTRAGRVAAIVLRMALTMFLAAVMLSCGGAATSSRNTLGAGGTTVGTGGTAGVTGTSGGINMPGSTSVTFPLTVQAQSGLSVLDVGTVSVTVP
jgi:hypothetical protein